MLTLFRDNAFSSQVLRALHVGRTERSAVTSASPRPMLAGVMIDDAVSPLFPPAPVAARLEPIAPAVSVRSKLRFAPRTSNVSHAAAFPTMTPAAFQDVEPARAISPWKQVAQQAVEATGASAVPTRALEFNTVVPISFAPTNRARVGGMVLRRGSSAPPRLLQSRCTAPPRCSRLALVAESGT